MPINAVCPECQNRFQLQEAMVGKSMRCPNCHEVFIVRDSGPGSGPTVAATPPAPAQPKPAPAPAPSAPRTRTDAPPVVVSRTGMVTDFVQVIKDVSTAAPPPAAPPARPAAPAAPPAPIKPKESPRVDKIKPPTSADFPWDEGPKKPVAPPPRSDKPKPPPPSEFPWDESGKPKPVVPPKSKVWTPDFAPPTGPAVEEPAPDDLEYDPSADGFRREHPAQYQDGDLYATEAVEVRPADAAARPPKKTHRKVILYGMLAFVLIGLGTGGFFLWKYIKEAPDRLFTLAKKEYDDAHFNEARAKFQKFIADYPDDKRIPEARFFSDLSDLRHATASVTVREDPQPAINQWKQFLQLTQDEQIRPFAAKERFGIDIWQGGVRLLEAVVGKATDAYSDDDPTVSEKWLKESEEIIKALEPFQPEGAAIPASALKEISALKQRITVARVTFDDVNKAKELLGSGTDEEIARAENFAKSKGPRVHERFQELLRIKEEELQSKAIYIREPQPIPPTNVPDDGLTSLLFAPRFDKNERRPLSGISAVFFCLARGVLYALAEDNGQVLWAARTGLDTDIMPVRVAASQLHPELVLLASNTGNQFGITARSARNGAPLWHQALAVPCQGPPVVVGPNAYVSLGDRDGTILEITLATGEITGRISIGRPLGPHLAPRQGTGLLYIPAESRAVYVFDVDRHDENARRLEPIRVGVMNTGHAPGTLRGVPVFSNPDPNEPGPKFLVLGQADGLDSMKLRAYRLPDAPDAPGESPPPAEIVLPGWASFPPHCDGEKLAIVTDKGEFGLYGLKLAFNNDAAIFAFPARPAKPGEQRPSRGQVVIAEEGVFWILVSGELRKLRFGINAAEGVRMIPHGEPIPVGEPLHNPQVNPRGDTFVVVTQEGMNCRATAVNAINGDVRWRRELGMMAKGEPLRIGDSLVFLDHGGGFYKVDTRPLTEKTAAWLVDERWLIAQPARGYSAVTNLIRGPGDTGIAVLALESDPGSLLVRKFIGNAVEDRKWTPGHALAGQPVVSGNWLMLPLTNGALYRISIPNLASPPEEGPSWRADRLPASTPCYLSPLDADEYFGTDGTRAIVRWRWVSTTKAFEMVGKLKLPERPAATPAVVPGSPPRVVIADGRGNLTMWDGDKLEPPMLKYWRPGGRKILPAGPVSDGLRLESDGAGPPYIVYMVDGRVVWLSPDADGPKWVGPSPIKGVEGRPVVVNGQVYITDRAGVVRIVDAKTGLVTREEFSLTGSHAFAAGAVPIGNNRVLVPLVDGTVVLGELKLRKEENPAKAVPFFGQLIPE